MQLLQNHVSQPQTEYALCPGLNLSGIMFCSMDWLYYSVIDFYDQAGSISNPQASILCIDGVDGCLNLESLVP